MAAAGVPAKMTRVKDQARWTSVSTGSKRTLEDTGTGEKRTTRLTSFSHQVRVPLIDLLLPSIGLVLKLGSFLPGDGELDVEDSSVHDEVRGEGGGRVDGEDRRSSERVDGLVSDLEGETDEGRCQWRLSKFVEEQERRLTGTLLAPLPVSTFISRACSTARSASSFFQKQTNPVPRDRPVALSRVIRAYRRGP